MGTRRIKVQKSGKISPTGLDETSISERFSGWIQAYSRWIMGVALSAIAVAVMVWGVDAYNNYKEGQARNEYAKLSQKWPAEGTQQPEKWQEYIQSSNDFLKSHGGTRTALGVELDLSRALFHTRQFEESARMAKKVLDGVSEGDQLQLLARYQLAMAYEALGKPDEAMAQLGRFKAEDGSGLEREMHWHLARYYSGRQEYSKAVENYEKALKSAGRYPQDALLQSELSAVREKGRPVSPS